MTSLGLVFDPADLDYAHVSSTILKTVQSSLTPRLQSGRGDAVLVAKLVSRAFRNSVPWLTYSLEIRGSYPGRVPRSAIAIVFPKGAPAKVMLQERTQAIRNIIDWAAPKIYGTSFEGDPKSYHVVVLEDVESAGTPLHTLWPNLDTEQKKIVIDKIADILCAPIHIRPPASMQLQPDPPGSTPFLGPGSASTIASSSSAALSNAENHARSQIPPTNLQYLHKAYRVVHDGLFHPNGEPNVLAFRERFKEFNTYELSEQDIIRVKSLNMLLQENINDFSGGSFLPPHITGRNKESFKGQKERDKFTERIRVLEVILSKPLFRLQHKSMEMPYFFVTFESDGKSIKSVVLTQWEKAYFAPLWASCQLPPWLEPLNPDTTGISSSISPPEMTQWREYLVYHCMMKKERLAKSWLWFVAYIYGELERHFEMILTTTWVANATTEPWLRRLVEEAKKKKTMAYKKGSDPGAFVPFSGKVGSMDVNFSEMMGKWMPYARTFVVEEGLLTLPLQAGQ